MGIRADFYVRNEKKEPKMEWLGSIAWDGYEIDEPILKATTEDEFKSELKSFLELREDATLPKDGWPWPWNDSRTTDYAYIFENGKVLASCFGNQLFDPLLPQNEDDEDSDELKTEGYFPDMKDIKNVQFGDKSGLIIIQSK